MKRWLIITALLLGAAGFAAEVLLFSDTHFDDKRYQFTDPGKRKHEREHIRNAAAWAKYMPELLKAAGRTAAERKADFAVLLGDVAQGGFASSKLHEQAFDDFRTVCESSLPVPLLALIGNHDIRGGGKAYRNAVLPWLDRALGEIAGGNVLADDTNRAFVFDRDLYLLLDSNALNADFVTKALNKFPESRHTLVFVHHPLLPFSPKHLNWPQMNNPAREEILAALAPRNAVILCGHTHQTNILRVRLPGGTLTQFNAISLLTEVDFAPRVVAFDPAGYAAIPTFSEELKKLDREKRDRFSAYASGAVREFVRIDNCRGFYLLNIGDEGVSVDIHPGSSGKKFATLPLVSTPAAR